MGSVLGWGGGGDTEQLPRDAGLRAKKGLNFHPPPPAPSLLGNTAVVQRQMTV